MLEMRVYTEGKERQSRVNSKRGAALERLASILYVIKSRLCLLAEEGKKEGVNKGTRDGGKGEMKRCKGGWGGQTIRQTDR